MQCTPSGIDGHQLTVEITESMMMEHDTEIFKRIQILRDMGVGLLVDDLYGLFRIILLSQSSGNEIKIDKSLSIVVHWKTHPCLT